MTIDDNRSAFKDKHHDMLVRFGAKNTVSLGSNAIKLSEDDALRERCDGEDEYDYDDQPNQGHAPHQPIMSCIIAAVASVSWNGPPIGAPAGTLNVSSLDSEAVLADNWPAACNDVLASSDLTIGVCRTRSWARRVLIVARVVTTPRKT